jgi:predicted SprT family Zn-dependent metalloprotease
MAPYLPGKKLLLLLNATEWDLMGKARRVALLFHELSHVASDEKGYKIVKHDVSDFKELITKVGFSYENSAALLKELEGT